MASPLLAGLALLRPGLHYCFLPPSIYLVSHNTPKPALSQHETLQARDAAAEQPATARQQWRQWQWREERPGRQRGGAGVAQQGGQTWTLDLDLEKIRIYHLLNWAFISNTQFMLIPVQIGEAQTLRGGSSNAKSW